MPARRSRTMEWRRCLEEICNRGGAVEIAIAREPGADPEGTHLIWRVRLLQVGDRELVIEQPTTLGQPIHIESGVALTAFITIGQNRWVFQTSNIGESEFRMRGRSIVSQRLALPENVERCHRRTHDRLTTTGLTLPQVELWPLLDPQSVVVAERASELQFFGDIDTSATDTLEEDDVLPEVGPQFTGTLVNIGGGGAGIVVRGQDAQPLGRHKVFWVRFRLPPELTTPVCATSKLVHTHIQSDQNTYAGLAFDFTFNPGHQRLVADMIQKFVTAQQLGERKAG